MYVKIYRRKYILSERDEELSKCTAVTAPSLGRDLEKESARLKEKSESCFAGE